MTVTCFTRSVAVVVVDVDDVAGCALLSTRLCDAETEIFQSLLRDTHP